MPTAASALLLLALAGAAASCGGNPAKEGLRAYESSMEGLMDEDRRVSSSLSDLRKDLFAANAKAEDQARFARETGVPFFTRFRDAAAAVPTADPRLETIHGVLLNYIALRLQYLTAMETCLAAADAAPMKQLAGSMAAAQAARVALQEKTGGEVDREVAEAFGTGQLFLERVFAPFQRGEVDADYVEKALREQVLPRIGKVAARPPGEEGSTAAAVAAWARAELAFFETVAASLESQSAAQEALRSSEDHWSRSQELRTEYLEGLMAYRESIR